MGNGLYFYSTFYTTFPFHSHIHTARLILQATQCFLLHIHTPMNALVDNMGFSVLPKDASTRGLGKPAVEPPSD